MFCYKFHGHDSSDSVHLIWINPKSSQKTRAGLRNDITLYTPYSHTIFVSQFSVNFFQPSNLTPRNPFRQLRTPKPAKPTSIAAWLDGGLRCPAFLSHDKTIDDRSILNINYIYIGLSPFPVTVTTRIITFLVGNPYKPSFATVTGRGDTPIYIHKVLDPLPK